MAYWSTTNQLKQTKFQLTCLNQSCQPPGLPRESLTFLSKSVKKYKMNNSSKKSKWLWNWTFPLRSWRGSSLFSFGEYQILCYEDLSICCCVFVIFLFCVRYTFLWVILEVKEIWLENNFKWHNIKYLYAFFL